MFRVILVLISTLAPLFVAKAVNGSIETSKALTANAVNRISARVFRQMTWTLIGISFFATGVILGALEAAEVWGVAFTPTLGVKLALIVAGGACLYVGLRKPEPLALEHEKSREHEGGVDWQSLLAVVLERMKASAEESRAEAAAARATAGAHARADLSPEDLDRIVAALRDQPYRSRPGQGPDLTAH